MRPLLAIFAHPDDEAFGPSGSLAKFAQEREVYLVCVTNGDAGQNATSLTVELGEIRKKELLQSAEILGIKQVIFLGYKDGSLSNNLYHEVAAKIEQLVEELQPEALLTFDHQGISGHLDHIFVSLVSTFIYRKSSLVKKLYLYGEREESLQKMRDSYFIYVPAGFKQSEIDLAVDISAVWPQKVAAIKAHESQKNDGEEILKNADSSPKVEHFKIFKK
jgi:LmbE family N-acetylglucosaminyl deacetylase